MPISAVIIGSGNLSRHLTPILKKQSKLQIVQIISRNKVSGPGMARKLHLPFTTKLSEINREAQMVFLMVNDSSLKTLTEKLKKYLPPKTTIVHFSGASDIDIIDNHFTNRGNVWPIYSFSAKIDSVKWQEVPICICSNNHRTEAKLKDLFDDLSERVSIIDKGAKPTLHLAAVLANNFTNHLLHISKDLLEHKELSFDILKPIIQQTVDQVMSFHPRDTQSGPALRGDRATMSAHLELLSDKPAISKIYSLISESIKDYSK